MSHLSIPAEPPPQVCPLCQSREPKSPTRGADSRRYYHCHGCELIFVDPRDFLSLEEQRAHYLTHENSIDNSGYVAFLRRVIDPMLRYLSPSMRGLDFGCGPGPTLSVILSQHGIACENYDPFFVDHTPSPPYDFIFATECFEHFAAPDDEMRRLHALLAPGGYLGIMTELWTDQAAFGRWYYTRDATHVAFFRARTIAYLCQNYGFERLPSDDRRVVILRKGEESPAPTT